MKSSESAVGRLLSCKLEEIELEKAHHGDRDEMLSGTFPASHPIAASGQTAIAPEVRKIK